MSVSYSLALQRSGERARRMLFRPFAFEKWLVLGFAAFLSEWMSGGWGRGGGGRTFGWHGHHPFGAPVYMDDQAMERIREVFQHFIVWLPLIAAVACAVLLVALLFQWIGARGKFVFLDCVVRERVAIREPWRQYARQGQSLFLWKLVYWLVVGVLLLIAVLPALGTVTAFFSGEHDAFALAGPVLLSVMLMLPIGLGSTFVMVLLDDFVTPLMYRHGLTTNEAWRRFSPLLSREWPSFVMYAILLLMLVIIFALLVIVVGFGTCCVGFLLMAAPYIGQVFLLPVYVFFRGFGPEFLAQYGGDYDVFAGLAPAPAPAPAAPVPPAPPAPTA